MIKTYKMLNREQSIGEKLEVYIPLRNEQGATHSEIAAELGIHQTELSVWLDRLGLRTVSRIVPKGELVGAS